MAHGMNLPLAKLKAKLAEVTQQYGSTHWVFIAPYDLPTCKKIRAMQSNVLDGVPLSDTFLTTRKDLDIYFIDKVKNPRPFKDGWTMTFERLSLGGVK